MMLISGNSKALLALFGVVCLPFGIVFLLLGILLSRNCKYIICPNCLNFVAIDYGENCDCIWCSEKFIWDKNKIYSVDISGEYTYVDQIQLWRYLWFRMLRRFLG